MTHLSPSLLLQMPLFLSLTLFFSVLSNQCTGQQEETQTRVCFENQEVFKFDLNDNFKVAFDGLFFTLFASFQKSDCVEKSRQAFIIFLYDKKHSLFENSLL